MYAKNGNPKDKNPKDKNTKPSKDEELQSLQRILNDSELNNKKLKFEIQKQSNELQKLIECNQNLLHDLNKFKET